MHRLLWASQGPHVRRHHELTPRETFPLAKIPQEQGLTSYNPNHYPMRHLIILLSELFGHRHDFFYAFIALYPRPAYSSSCDAFSG
jgi:hypothetical protein